MNKFEKIETQLTAILDQGYKILDHLEADSEMEQVQELLEERGKQIEALNKIRVEKDGFTDHQRTELDNLFTRFSLLEKQINKILAKLSLLSKTSLKEVSLHKKAKKSYESPFKTSKFLNAQITG